MADRDHLRAETQGNVFSNTSERLFLTLQCVYGKVKLALNQKYINNAQIKFLQQPISFKKKELGADTVRFVIMRLLINHDKKLVWVVSAECRKRSRKNKVKFKKPMLKGK